MLHVPMDVRLEGFTPLVRDFLARFVEEYWGHPMPVVPFESAAALVFLLKAADEESFPSGKWATVQHLESLVEGAAARVGA